MAERIVLVKCPTCGRRQEDAQSEIIGKGNEHSGDHFRYCTRHDPRTAEVYETNPTILSTWRFGGLKAVEQLLLDYPDVDDHTVALSA